MDLAFPSRVDWIGSGFDARVCVASVLFVCHFHVSNIVVQRVHWLRARAQKNRWQEELILVGYEMEWTTRYFLHRAGNWKAMLVQEDLPVGPKAYAARQAAQWEDLAFDAEQAFRIVNRKYIHVM
jgi:hypothetical protein